MIDAPPISQLSQVISQSIAPAFILGAVSGFISVLVTRLNRVIDRCRELGAANRGDRPQGPAPGDLSTLNARAALINRALLWAIGSALTTVILMVLAFADAFFHFPHETGVAVLFIVALILFGAALVSFAMEIALVIRDPNNFD